MAKKCELLDCEQEQIGDDLENADRMGARIKSNRLGSSVKQVQVHNEDGCLWILRRMEKPQPKFSKASEKQCKRQNMRNRRSPTFITAEHQKRQIGMGNISIQTGRGSFPNAHQPSPRQWSKSFKFNLRSTKTCGRAARKGTK